jgi:hypothetical protein
MSPFEFLLLAHLIGDYLFQTKWMALNKSTKWVPLLTHVGVYTLTITCVAWIGFGGLTAWGIVVVIMSHIILDRRLFVTWWTRRIMRIDEKESGWLIIVTDQIFHILVLGLVLYI